MLKAGCAPLSRPTGYGLTWVEAWGVRPNPVLAKAREIISLTRA
ncbi:MAG: hypothetical protein Q7O12_07740 [Deltaproteobacteria bacterium]|nr:hypothetical protein [Deltaproteobacteria bacterium]